MKKLFFTLFISLLFFSSCSKNKTSSSVLLYEHLFQNLPPSYKLLSQEYKNKTRVLTFIPLYANKYNYEEIIRTRIYEKKLQNTVSDYIYKLKMHWFVKCKNSSLKRLGQGREQNYEVAFLLLSCPSIQGRKQTSFIKILQGKERFYTIEKTFSYKPNAREIVQTMLYLKSIKICDARRNKCLKNKSKKEYFEASTF